MEGKIELTNLDALHALATTTVVVGAMCEGKANFLAVAWAMPASFNPPALAITLNKAHKTNDGIRAARSFSVSVFRAEDAVRADYVGIKSGKEVDKSAVFRTVPGPKTGTPLLPELPLTIELSLLHVLDVSGTHEIFVGKVEGVYASSDALMADGSNKIDASKLAPVLFTFSPPSYRALGPQVAQPWQAGLAYTAAASAPAEKLPHVDVETCVGCGTCVGACPHELFEMTEEGKARFKEEQKDQCAHCGECADSCPATAITMQ